MGFFGFFFQFYSSVASSPFLGGVCISRTRGHSSPSPEPVRAVLLSYKFYPVSLSPTEPPPPFIPQLFFPSTRHSEAACARLATQIWSQFLHSWYIEEEKKGGKPSATLNKPARRLCCSTPTKYGKQPSDGSDFFSFFIGLVPLSAGKQLTVSHPAPPTPPSPPPLSQHCM